MSELKIKRTQKILFFICLCLGWFLIAWFSFSITSFWDGLILLGLNVCLSTIYFLIWQNYKAKISYEFSWKKNVLTRLKLEGWWTLSLGLLSGVFLLIFFSIFKSEELIGGRQVFLLLCFVLWLLFMNFGGEFLHLVKQNKVLETRIRLENREQIKLQKEMLQDLISPHFLFNSLNTIVSIIPEDKEKAVEFVNELSELYNFMLKNSQKEALLIKEDVFLAKKYVFLLKTRLESSLNVKFDIENKYLSCYVPPFTLQNLIENAVKHNSITKKQNLNLEIYVDDTYLVVKNNLNPRLTQAETSTQLGLNYIKTLMENLTELPILVEKTEFDFLVKIPLIYQLNSENA